MTTKILTTYRAPEGDSIATETITHDASVSVDATIAALANNAEVDVAIDKTVAKSILLLADADMTVKTNSSSNPSDTIALLAGVPWIWRTGYVAQPLTASITKLYVTSTAGGTLTVRAGYDATP